MQWLRVFCIYMLLSIPYAFANHSTLRVDPFNTLPDSNLATFRTNSRTFWDHEEAQQNGRHHGSFVYSGGLHATSSSRTSPAFGTEAFVPERINQSSTAIDYSNGGSPGGCLADDTAWTIISSDNNGIAGWVRVGTTAYYYRCEGDTTPTQPSLPPNSVWLMGPITIASGAITAVTDARPLDSQFACSYSDLPAALSAIGTTRTALIVDCPLYVNGTVTLLQTTSLSFTPRGRFVAGSSPVLTINSPLEDTKRQIFSGFTGSQLIFGSGSVDFLRPEWFGTIPDGVTNGVAGWNAAIAASFASTIATIRLSQGSYYLATPVTINNTEHNLRISCESMARWPIVAGQCRITGANGQESLFILANAAGWALEIDHVSFEGTNPTTGVVSAIKSTGGSVAPRPVVIHHSTFRGFARALHSTAAYGFSTLSVRDNTFLGNTCALWSTALNGVINMTWSSNISEAGGSICSDPATSGSYGGGINITDNNMEGQADAIVLNCGLCAVTVARNYFEANTGNILNVVSTNTGSSLTLGPNFYTSSNGARINIDNMYFENHDNIPQTIYLSAKSLGAKSKIKQTYNYLFTSNQDAFANALDINTGIALRSAATTANIPFGTALATGVIEQTPLGMRRTDLVTTASNYYDILSADIGGDLLANDHVVVTALVAGGTATWLNVMIRHALNTVICQLGENAFFPFTDAPGEWMLIHVACKVSSGSPASFRITFSTAAGLTFLVSDFFVYRQTGISNTSKIPLVWRALELAGIGSLLAAASSTVITHDLGFVPRTINVTPQGNVGFWWVSTITATQFTFNVSAAPGVIVPFSWRVN